jgi:hypothetical protein
LIKVVVVLPGEEPDVLVVGRKRPVQDEGIQLLAQVLVPDVHEARPVIAENSVNLIKHITQAFNVLFGSIFPPDLAFHLVVPLLSSEGDNGLI